MITECTTCPCLSPVSCLTGAVGPSLQGVPPGLTPGKNKPRGVDLGQTSLRADSPCTMQAIITINHPLFPPQPPTLRGLLQFARRATPLDLTYLRIRQTIPDWATGLMCIAQTKLTALYPSRYLDQPQVADVRGIYPFTATDKGLPLATRSDCSIDVQHHSMPIDSTFRLLQLA